MSTPWVGSSSKSTEGRCKKQRATATMTATALASSSTAAHHSARNANNFELAGGITATAGKIVSESRTASGTYLTVVTGSGKATS